MTQSSNIDAIFQMTAALLERPAAVEALDADDRPAFGQHLAHASASSHSDTTSPRSRDNNAALQPPEDRRLTANSSDFSGSSDGASPDAATDDDACSRGPEMDDCSAAASPGRQDAANAEPTSAEAKDETAGDARADGEHDPESQRQPNDEVLTAGAVAVAAEQTVTAVHSRDAGAAGHALDEANGGGHEAPLTSRRDVTGDGDTASSAEANSRNAENTAAIESLNSVPEADQQHHGTSKSAPQGGLLSPSQRVVAAAPLRGLVPAGGAAGSAESAGATPAGAHKVDRRRKAGSPGEAAGTVSASIGVGPTASQKSDAAESLAAGSRERRSVRPAARRGGPSRIEKDPTPGNNAAAASNRPPGIVAANPFSVAPISDTPTGSDRAVSPVRRNSTAAKSDTLPHHLTRSQRPHGTSGRGVRRSGAANLPHVDATRFVGRVAKAVQTAHERGGALQLRLSPPELGSLRLQLVVENGVMSAALEAENATARQVLLDHLPALRERLAEQNIRIERFDVDVRQEDSSRQSDGRAAQQEQHDRRPNHTVARHSLRATVADDVPRTPLDVSLRPNTGGLNVLA